MLEIKKKLTPRLPIPYSASRTDSLILETDFCIFCSPIYLLTRVEHAIPTPIAGIKEVHNCENNMCCREFYHTYNSNNLQKKSPAEGDYKFLCSHGKASRNCPQSIFLSKKKKNTLNLFLKSPENR